MRRSGVIVATRVEHLFAHGVPPDSHAGDRGHTVIADSSELNSGRTAVRTGRAYE